MPKPARRKSELGLSQYLKAKMGGSILPVPEDISGSRKPIANHSAKGSRVVGSPENTRVVEVAGVAGFFENTHVVSRVGNFLASYIVAPGPSVLVAATWAVAAWLAPNFDRFPHLAITSPEKRCGKTRFLQLLEQVVPNPYNVANISPAAIYRLIQHASPLTLMLDEAQSLVRRGSEASEVIRELFCAGIDRNARVIRCGGSQMDEVREFPIFCPKAIAMIGELDGVLADRCLSVRLERKTAEQSVKPYRSRIVLPEGKAISADIEQWAAENEQRIAEIYDSIEPFDIENDRLAELLLPLQAVLTLVDKRALEFLWQYAREIDQAEQDRVTPGVLLLMACFEIFGKRDFQPTAFLLESLNQRLEEPWHRWNHGRELSPEGLARLIKPFGIKPSRIQRKIGAGKVQTTRGYHRHDFIDAWARYLPPPS